MPVSRHECMHTCGTSLILATKPGDRCFHGALGGLSDVSSLQEPLPLPNTRRRQQSTTTNKVYSTDWQQVVGALIDDNAAQSCMTLCNVVNRHAAPLKSTGITNKPVSITVFKAFIFLCFDLNVHLTESYSWQQCEQ
jgi:hypothetical protein